MTRVNRHFSIFLFLGLIVLLTQNAFSQAIRPGAGAVGLKTQPSNSNTLNPNYSLSNTQPSSSGAANTDSTTTNLGSGLKTDSSSAGVMNGEIAGGDGTGLKTNSNSADVMMGNSPGGDGTGLQIDCSTTSAGLCGTLGTGGTVDTSASGVVKPASGGSGDTCGIAISTANSVCKGSGAVMAAQQAAGVASIAQASTANAGAACTMQSKIAAAQSAMQLLIAGACGTEIYKCKSACTNDSRTSTCDSFDVMAGLAAAQGAANGLAAKAAEDCAKAYNAALNTTPTPVIAETCTTNANYAATHTLECYCATNPSDAKCLNSALALNAGGLATGGLSSGLSKSALSGDPNTAGPQSAYTMPKNDGANTGAAAAGATSGGGGYGGGAPAAAAMAATPDDAAAPAGSGNGGNVFGGYSAGQGGFSYGKGGSGSDAAGGNGMMKALASKLNLNNLLPNHDYANRSIAGMAGSSADGITGPNGPSIWDKVSRRYQIKKGELLPP